MRVFSGENISRQFERKEGPNSARTALINTHIGAVAAVKNKLRTKSWSGQKASC